MRVPGPGGGLGAAEPGELAGFTLAGGEADSYAAGVVREITGEIVRRLGEAGCAAVLLTGSFGRGEGGVRWGEAGWEVVNDIEFVVIQEMPTPERLAGLGAELAERLGIYKVDIGVRRLGAPRPKELSIFEYDERYGSRVVYGDAAVLERFGEADSAAIPAWEGVRLLVNRGGGLLMHFTLARYQRRSSLPADVRQHMKNQLIKAAVALGDAYLVERGLYHMSYERRAELFAGAAGGADDYPRDALALIEASYAEKLVPDSRPLFADLFGGYEEVLRHYVPGLLSAASRHFDIPVRDLDAFGERMLRRRRPGAVFATLRALKRAVSARRLPERRDWTDDLRRQQDAVGAAIPSILVAAPFLAAPDVERLVRATRWLELGRGLRGAHEDAWERARAECWERWYAGDH